VRGPAGRQLRFMLFVAGAVGAVAAQLAARRLPGHALLWMACVPVWTMLVVAAGAGAAWLAAGHRLDRRAATALAGGSPPGRAPMSSVL
jgi:hypothetical protein